MKETLSRLRKTRKMTQQEVAESIGIARNTYTQYEIGRRIPDYETIRKLAAFYNVSVDYLLDGTSDQSIQLLDVLSQPQFRIFIGDYEVNEAQSKHLLTIVRTFAEALSQK